MFKLSRYVVVTLLGILLLGLPQVQADELYMADGSIVFGELVSLDDGKINFTTSFAGQLAVDAGRVVGINTEQPVLVAMPSGDRVSGTLRYDPEAGQTLSQTTFGDVEVLLPQLTAIWRAEDETAGPDAAVREERIAAVEQRHAEEAELQRQRLEALETTLDEAKAEWTARIEAGLTGQTGNSESLAFHGRAEARRTTAADRLLVYIQGRFSEQNGVRNENEIFGGMDLEVDLSERWYVFGRMYLEHDEFENLELRARVTAGLGYFAIREEDQELKLFGGVGYEHETFTDGTTEDDGLLELGYDYMLEVEPWLLFRHGLTVYPKFDDLLGDFRAVAETSGEVPLGTSPWKVRAGVRNQYDAKPAAGIDKLDTFYFLNLVMDFE